jgi:hypothetical protein
MTHHSNLISQCVCVCVCVLANYKIPILVGVILSNKAVSLI